MAGRRPWASINYAASHDGFTLSDIVSYAERHNEANREATPTAIPANFSNNWGVEGPTDDPSIEATRARVMRALLATVFLSAGTPMLLAGDEFGRTQQGNNNAYCQDNEISWVNWRLAVTPSGKALIEYVGRLIALRREHPVLRCKVFLHGIEHPTPDISDIAWFDESGGTISAAAWNDREQRTLILRRADKNADGKVSILTLLLNPTAEARDFRLPLPLMPFRVLIDSATAGTAEDWRDAGGLSVAAHSAMLLFAQR